MARKRKAANDSPLFHEDNQKFLAVLLNCLQPWHITKRGVEALSAEKLQNLIEPLREVFRTAQALQFGATHMTGDSGQETEVLSTPDATENYLVAEKALVNAIKAEFPKLTERIATPVAFPNIFAEGFYENSPINNPEFQATVRNRAAAITALARGKPR